MIQRSLLIATMATAAVSASFAGATLNEVFSFEKDLKFDDLFPRRSHMGPSGSSQGWSQDDRYLAFFWSKYDEPGRDIFLYDARSGKTERLTTPDTFRPFDRDIPKALEWHKENEERLNKWMTLSDEEYRAERQKYREEQERPRGDRNNARYSGPSELTWANTRNEFLFTYRGDIYRMKLGQDKPERLTMTSDSESSIAYLPDDSGFLFQRGGAVYRMGWDSPFVMQISPQLTGGVNFGGFQISPDGKSMMVRGNRAAQGGNQRTVDYIVYRDRFAQARTTQRGVADDDFRGETYLYLYDIRPETLNDMNRELKPVEIWNWKGGEEWQETSISNDPWSPDGKNFVFASWKRDKQELIIHEADLSNGKVRDVYKSTVQGDHNTPGMTRPFYTKDGKHIVALLDKQGWRHAHLIERIYGAETPLTSGNYEVYPVRMSADGKSVIVESSKEDLSRLDLYKVNIETKAVERMTQKDGRYNASSWGHKSDKVAYTFSSWNDLRELYVLDGKKETQITDSHKADAFWAPIKMKPELFTYKNRHGDTIHGYMFLPENHSTAVEKPLFIYVYGGPLGSGKSVEDGTFNTTAYLFNMYLTHTLGYVTAVIDPRGQSGYSAEFGKANWNQVGKAQTEDLVDLVEYMDKTYNIDRTRVGLNGWSFGGFQTQHAMYTEPDVFTLGIAGAGPTEWQNYNTWYSGGVVGNAEKGKPDEIDKYSLTHVAKNLKHPLMLLHGVEDTNVLYQDTIMVYRKLLQAGKGHLVELSIDPTGGHGMGGDMDTRDRHMIYLAFIARHWGVPGRA